MSTPSRDDLLADLSHYVQSLSRTLIDHIQQIPDAEQLSPLEVITLRHIDENPGIAPSAIGADLGLRSSNVSAALRSLERRDFIQRQRDPRDGRAVQVTVTDHARASIARVRAGVTALLDGLLPPDAPLAETVELLRNLERSMRS